MGFSGGLRSFSTTKGTWRTCPYWESTKIWSLPSGADGKSRWTLYKDGQGFDNVWVEEVFDRNDWEEGGRLVTRILNAAEHMAVKASMSVELLY